MSEAESRALELAMARVDSNPDDFEPGVIRVPGNKPQGFNQDSQLQERGDQQDLLDALRGANLAALSEEQRDALLEELVAKNNQHTDKRRDVQTRSEELDLENKRKFTSLALNLAKGFGIFALLGVTLLLGLLAYAVIFDKSMIDGTIIGGFLTAFGELFKALFMAY